MSLLKCAHQLQSTLDYVSCKKERLFRVAEVEAYNTFDEQVDMPNAFSGHPARNLQATVSNSLIPDTNF